MFCNIFHTIKKNINIFAITFSILTNLYKMDINQIMGLLGLLILCGLGNTAAAAAQDGPAPIAEYDEAFECWEWNGMYFIIADENEHWVKFVEPIYHSRVLWDSLPKLFMNSSIDIPDKIQINGETYSVWAIESHAMNDLVNLSELSLPESMKVVEPYVCEGISADRILFAEGLRLIMHNCFNDMPKLSNLMFPCTLNIIGEECFNGTSASDITFAYGLQYIGDYSFNNNRNLKEVILPETLTHLGEHCFNECVNLETVCIPASMWRAKFRECFNNCQNIKRVVIDIDYTNRLEFNDCFRDCDEFDLIVPDGLKGAYESKARIWNFNCKVFEMSEYSKVNQLGNSNRPKNDYYDLNGLRLQSAEDVPTGVPFIECDGMVSRKVIRR